MHGLSQLVLVVSMLTVAGSMVFLVLELRRLVKLLDARLECGRLEPRRAILTTSHSHHLTSPAEGHPGFAVYVYRGGRWHLETDFSSPGFETTPPAIGGAYSGQVVKKQSTARKTAS
jgi:hypothetical protein